MLFSLIYPFLTVSKVTLFLPCFFISLTLF
nr:MAG TPA: hypothetical protein [Caudoviricetes sp.]